MSAENHQRRCPDDGACHHGCPGRRVFPGARVCAPLTAYGDDWKPEDVERFGGSPAFVEAGGDPDVAL